MQSIKIRAADDMASATLTYHPHPSPDAPCVIKMDQILLGLWSASGHIIFDDHAQAGEVRMNIKSHPDTRQAMDLLAKLVVAACNAIAENKLDLGHFN